MLNRFVKVFPHEYKRVLGLNKVQLPQVPLPSLPGEAQLKRAQHG
jgi:hypothetical protein